MKTSTRNFWAGALLGFLLLALPGLWLTRRLKDILDTVQRWDVKSVVIEPPYVVADFNQKTLGLSSGGDLVPDDNRDSPGVSIKTDTVLGPLEEGFDASSFLRWKLKMATPAGKPKGMGWSWQTLWLHEGGDLSKCHGIRFQVRASKPGIAYVISLRGFDNPCPQEDDVLEVKGNEAPLKWTRVDLPLKSFKRSKGDCPVDFKHVRQINYLVNGDVDASLDLDQIEIY